MKDLQRIWEHFEGLALLGRNQNPKAVVLWNQIWKPYKNENQYWLKYAQ